MTDRATLNDLMSAAADGDRAAVDPLFALLWPIVARYATRYLGDPVLAEDVAQDALVKLFGQLDRYDRERDALTWALTHATWQCRSARRQQGRRREASPPDDPISAVHDGRAAQDQRELVRAALETLASLNAPDRDTLLSMLTDDDELRRALAPATFRKRLERAVVRLRMSWRSRHGTL